MAESFDGTSEQTVELMRAACLGDLRNHYPNDGCHLPNLPPNQALRTENDHPDYEPMAKAYQAAVPASVNVTPMPRQRTAQRRWDVSVTVIPHAMALVAKPFAR